MDCSSHRNLKKECVTIVYNGLITSPSLQEMLASEFHSLISDFIVSYLSFENCTSFHCMSTAIVIIKKLYKLGNHP
jgi:hypothetical protein